MYSHKTLGRFCLGVFEPTVNILNNIGFDVVTSTVECCGMAGSFGYKRHFYEVSRRVADDLVRQIEQAEGERGARVLVASGTSCREQIETEMKRLVIHPIEILERTLTK